MNEVKPQFGVIRKWQDDGAPREILCPVHGTIIQGRLSWQWTHPDGITETGIEPEGAFIWWAGRNSLHTKRPEWCGAIHGQFLRAGTTHMRMA